MSRVMKPKWSYWLLNGLGLLWGLLLAMDYVMMKTRNTDYLANIPEPALAYFDSFPIWMSVLWAIVVWGTLSAWVLMLLRRRLAAQLFLVVLICIVINFAYWIPTGGFTVQDTFGRFFTGFVMVMAVFGVWLSRRKQAMGYLK